jgi:hypothetical protein
MTLASPQLQEVEVVEPAWADGVGIPERLARWFADNRLFTGVLVVATVVRLLVEVAYAPALEFFGDSYDYMQEAGHLSRVDIWHPPGYPFFLWLVSATHSVAMVTVIQHALGLATGIVLYRSVRRFGVGTIGATLAALPVLLDAYQLDVEQIVLSETLFTLFVVLAMARCLRLRDRSAGLAPAVFVGLLLATATLTRTVGIFVAGVVLLWLVATRIGIARIVAVAAAFAMPVLGYALAFHSAYGVTGLQGYSGRYLYGMVGQFADCHGLKLTKQQHLLCPTLPTHARPGLSQYVWDASAFPLLKGPDIRRSQVAGAFARKVLMHQPAAFAGVVAGNFGHYFEPGRDAGPRDWFAGSWQFPENGGSPAWHIQPATVTFGGVRTPLHARIDPGLAGFLHGYQRIFYTPGPLLAVLLPLTLGALVLRRRDRRAADAAVLLTSAGLLLLVVPSATAGFDWRYLLPAQALLIPGAVIAWGLLRRELAGNGWFRRARPVVIVALVATTLLGVLPASGYALRQLTPHRIDPVPALLPIGSRLSINVEQPHVVDTACIATTHGFRMSALVAFPTTANFRTGSQVLMQPSNFAVADQDAVDTPRVDGERVHDSLPTMLLDRTHRRATGQVYVPVTAPSGQLRFVDPLGAGAAAWSFRIVESELLGDVLGTRCTRETAWAGLRVRVLKITGVPTFTASAAQTIGYGLTRKPGRAASFDVRWQQAAPNAAMGSWRYPRSWQHTAAHNEQLLNLQPGYTYCFAVRARDIAGAATAWTQPSCTTKLYDDSNLPIGPGWQENTGQAGFYFNTYLSASTKGATLTGVATFARVALLAYRCETCGVVDIYLGGKLIQTLDLGAGPTGEFTWLSRPFPARTTTFALKVVTDGKPVAIDGLGLEP